MLQEWADKSFLEACGISWMMWAVIPLRLLLVFLCFCSEHVTVEITFSKAQMHLPKSQGPDEHFGICVPWSRALGEKLEQSRCSDQECTQPCSFLTHCVTLLGMLLCFSATGCYETNFCRCNASSHGWKSCKREVIWDNSCTSFPPPLPSSSDSNLCPHTASWPQLSHSKVIHKVNTKRHFLGQKFSPSRLQKGPSASLGTGVASYQPPQLHAAFALTTVMLVIGEETWL